MRIEVRADDHIIRVPLPTGLVFSSAAAYAGKLVIKKYAPQIWKQMPPDGLKVMFAELRRIKKKYGKWELAEVDAAGGEHIHIVL